MNTISPLSRSGSCLLANAALRADTISALEWPAITILVRTAAMGTIDRAAWRFRHSAPRLSGSRTQVSQTPPSSFFPPYGQTRSFLGQLFHSLAVPRPGSSRRWIWNRERRSAPAESQHSFPSSIGRQAPFSNIYPTCRRLRHKETDADYQHQGHDTDHSFPRGSHREVSFRRRRCSLSFMISLKSTTGRISTGPSPYLKPGS